MAAAQTDMATPFIQPHQNYNKNIQPPSFRTVRIELNGSLTTTELKKPQLSRLVGGVQTKNELVSHPRVVDKNSEGISWEPGPPAQGSSARKIRLRNFTTVLYFK